ncbi:MAG: alpha/beta fold hydrolase [Shimia sp.]|uniref:alpha/beta fold hydrolase n=1 Tax=Shimia sp. TaxID=1954381 RepID=UPI0040585D02
MTMTWQHTPLADGTAPSWHSNTDSPKVVFHHATALGPRCYAPFLDALTGDFDVAALAMRPLWPDAPAPDRKRGWDQFGDDLIDWLEATQSAPAFVVGHSIGAATTAMAAIKRPDLFAGLVLIEPSGVTGRIHFMLRAVPYKMRQTTGPAAEVLRGPTNWSDLETAFTEYRASRAYRRFDDATLRALVEALTVRDPKSRGIMLEYPRNWEAHLYAKPPHILPVLKKLSVPTQIITGKPSLFMDPSIARDLQKARPDLPFTQLSDYGHLLPLEAPQEVATATRTALHALL